MSLRYVTEREGGREGGRKEGRNQASKQGRKGGREGGRKEGGKQGRREARKEGSKQGNEGRKQASKQGKKQASKETKKGRKEARKEGSKQGNEGRKEGRKKERKKIINGRGDFLIIVINYCLLIIVVVGFQLYGDFADVFRLAECKLAIVFCAGHYDPTLIEAMWREIITKGTKPTICEANLA